MAQAPKALIWIRGDDGRRIGEVIPPANPDGMVTLLVIRGTEEQISERAEFVRDELREGRIPL